MDLKDIRVQIDEIDSQLVELFRKRMDCSAKVAESKKESSTPILNVQREEQILNKVEQMGKEYGLYTRLLYSNIMELSRDLQYTMIGGGDELRKVIHDAQTQLDAQSDKYTIACMGMSGSNSHIAAAKFFPKANICLEKNFDHVFSAVSNDKADFGVLPVENSSAGSVSKVYDLILKYRYYIVGEIDLPIEHCLCAIPQTSMSDIELVLSHEQGLAQCSQFISENGFKTKKFGSTSGAAQTVAEEKRINWAAVCSKEAADEYGLKILDKNIQNTDNNCTRFIVISKKPIITPNAQKISLCFSLPHRSGSLYNILCRFATHGLNLTKIESRPIPNSTFEYLFYLDFTGNVLDEENCRMICSLSEELPEFSFLGNY
ncbi:MAG: prephenate dehydratase [Lachnospiraceae bacterium]|nr:prephenate dehydratase [Lachnospiraceae bacterium]